MIVEFYNPFLFFKEKFSAFDSSLYTYCSYIAAELDGKKLLLNDAIDYVDKNLNYFMVDSNKNIKGKIFDKILIYLTPKYITVHAAPTTSDAILRRRQMATINIIEYREVIKKYRLLNDDWEI